jgi:NhaA family Na+:H+ antiporter
MSNTTVSNRVPSLLSAFLDNSASGGIVLMGAAALALIVANSSLGPSYFDALHAYVGGLSMLHWINDGLMAAVRRQHLCRRFEVVI